MAVETNALNITAATLGFFHTLLGPDHYLPFVMIAWARKWSGLKTMTVTFLCGIGHVGSSVVLGLAGVTIGIAVNKLQWFESVRGNLAAWLMIGFGVAYLVWGLRSAYRNRPHKHIHFHIPGVEPSTATIITASTSIFMTIPIRRTLRRGFFLSYLPLVHVSR
jgi:nickel/cobalt transporter (NicO) family protein